MTQGVLSLTDALVRLRRMRENMTGGLGVEMRKDRAALDLVLAHFKGVHTTGFAEPEEPARAAQATGEWPEVWDRGDAAQAELDDVNGRLA